ncbi:MAG: sulfur carrier protein ThiS [Thiomonas sp.]|nr:sulfur carrier protein ThiS [Thiomonas sp.]
MSTPSTEPLAVLRLHLNGEALNTPCATLAELLAERGYDTARAMACAVNQHFVPRTYWAGLPLNAGDRIEVVCPVVGG